MDTAYESSEWLPLEFAAEVLGRNLSHIRGQIKAGKLTRGVHFRRANSGGIELHPEAYMTWVDSERIRRRFERLGKTPVVATPKPVAAKQPSETMRRQPKLVPLSTWAELIFGEHQPHKNTLLNWVKNGKIIPVPAKIGRRYFCSPDARYYDPIAEEVKRMVEGL
jgi:Excisionase-like protein